VASVGRRRRNLALLKALGFTLGRWLWELFAPSIYTVPDAPVPVLSLLLVAGAVFVLGNAVAALPGAYAARTPAALLLRAE
jgi:hypothetical protein